MYSEAGWEYDWEVGEVGRGVKIMVSSISDQRSLDYDLT